VITRQSLIDQANAEAEEAENQQALPKALQLAKTNLRKQITPRVYFIQADKLRLIKIGFTRDIRDRLRTLQTCSPDRLTLIGAIHSKNGEQIEASLHKQFQADRDHGEWFRPSPALLETISKWTVEKADAAERMEWAAQQKAINALQSAGQALEAAHPFGYRSEDNEP